MRLTIRSRTRTCSIVHTPAPLIARYNAPARYMSMHYHEVMFRYAAEGKYPPPACMLFCIGSWHGNQQQVPTLAQLPKYTLRFQSRTGNLCPEVIKEKFEAGTPCA